MPLPNAKRDPRTLSEGQRRLDCQENYCWRPRSHLSLIRLALWGTCTPPSG